MKKTLALLLALGLAFSLCACNLAMAEEPMEKSEYGDSLPNTELGVSVTASVTVPGETWSLRVENSAGEDVAFQPEYTVEVRQEETWKNLPGMPLSVVIGNVVTLTNGQSYDLEVSLSRYDFDLEQPGSYRVVLPVTIRHSGQGAFDEYLTLAAPVEVQ